MHYRAFRLRRRYAHRASQTIADATTEAAGSEASTEGAEAADTLADVQEMTFVLNNEPDGIDPTITNNSFATPFLVNCFEGLVTYNEKGEVVPGNAESWESMMILPNLPSI
ncbi:MAG: hypothetical protein ACLS70_06395 [[Clostridium] symbiosum]